MTNFELKNSLLIDYKLNILYCFDVLALNTVTGADK